MPFNVVKYKRGFRVQDDKGNYYSKKPLTKTNARQQQKALYASEARQQHLSGSGYASYVDNDNNHHILLIGNGFFGNIFTKIKQVANYVSNTLLPVAKEPSLRTVSTAIQQSVRLDYPPAVRDIIARYGSGTIYNIVVVREPIKSFIDTALNFITAGRWGEAKKKYNYDKLFHLSMIASLSMPNGDKATIKLEKNEVISITDNFTLKQPGITSGSTSNVSQHGSGTDAEYMPVPVACCITLFDLVNNARTAVGTDFFKYDAFFNNCQVFIINLLKYNNLLTPEINTFVSQNAEQLLQELPGYTGAFANTITGIAGLANRIMKGEGEDDLYGGAECMMEQCSLEAKGMRGGMMRMNPLTIDTSAEPIHLTSLTPKKIASLKEHLQFGDDDSKDDMYKAIEEVIDYLLSDKSFLQSEYDEMEIGNAKSVIDKRQSKPYEFVNVLEKVLDRLQPKVEGGKLYCGLKETPPGDDRGNTYTCFKKGVGVGMMLEQQKPKPEKPLEEMTIRELGQEASKRKITNYGRMKKQELIDALRPLRGGAEGNIRPTAMVLPNSKELKSLQLLLRGLQVVSNSRIGDYKDIIERYSKKPDITDSGKELLSRVNQSAETVEEAIGSITNYLNSGRFTGGAVLTDFSTIKEDTPEELIQKYLQEDGSWSGTLEQWGKAGSPGCGPGFEYNADSGCYEGCLQKDEQFSCVAQSVGDKQRVDLTRLKDRAGVRTANQDDNTMSRYFTIEDIKNDEEGAKSISTKSQIPPIPKYADIPDYRADMSTTGYTGFAKAGDSEANANIMYYKDGKALRVGLKAGSTIANDFDWNKIEERWNRLQQTDNTRPGQFTTKRKDGTNISFDSEGREKFDANRHGSVEYLNSVEGRHIREADPYFEELYQRMLEQDHAYKVRSPEEAKRYEDELQSKNQKELTDRYGDNQDIYSPEANFTLTDKKGNKQRVNKVRLRKDGGYDIQFANGTYEYQAGEDEWDCNEWKKGDRIENYGVCGNEGRKNASNVVAQNINKERDQQWDKMSGWDKFVNGLSVAGSITQDYILPIASTVLQFVPGVGQAISTGLDVAKMATDYAVGDDCRHFNECTSQQIEKAQSQALYHRTKGDTVAERYLTDQNWANLLEANKKVYGLVGDTAQYGSRAGKFYETGAGKPSQPLTVFKKQLKTAGITPDKYLELAREFADDEGYEGSNLLFSDDPEKKLMMIDDEGKKKYFGSVGNGDYILWSQQEALGKVRAGYAEMKRRVFNISHNKIKGDWKKDRFSPNNLALKILWNMNA